MAISLGFYLTCKCLLVSIVFPSALSLYPLPTGLSSCLPVPTPSPSLSSILFPLLWEIHVSILSLPCFLAFLDLWIVVWSILYLQLIFSYKLQSDDMIPFFSILSTGVSTIFLKLFLLFILWNFTVRS